MGIDRAQFYDASKLLIVPMGFCFPGYTPDKSDLPPRRECRAVWHDQIFNTISKIDLILVIGRYAQAYHFRRLGRPLAASFRLEDVVRHWQDGPEGGPRVIALPHPSWRNTGWLRKNPWFEADVLPVLRQAVAAAMV
jgi:uracil-DNA glycosylase